MKNIYLVTGAAGFLGGTIVRQLIQRGDRVRAFVLDGDPAAKYLPEGAEVVTGDLCDSNSLDRLFDIPDGYKGIVMHIASIVTVDPAFNQKVMDVNVGGTENIISHCLSNPRIEKLVYCSSTGAIPEIPGDAPIAETNDFDADQVVGCYSQSKALATEMVLKAVREEGLNACVVHPSGIMGPEDFAVGETTGTLIKIINGDMPMGIDGSFNLCDVRDLARGTILAADNGTAGSCYILGNDQVSFRDFSRLVSEESGSKKVRFFLPLAAADFLAGILERRAKKTGEKPLMTRFSVYNLARNNRFDSSKARKELGYSTRSYRETIRDEVAWLKEAGLIA